MDKEIDFSCADVIFEITRFCNMACPHCIRGDAQKLRIKKEYINKVFENMPYISTLTISGGEPALAVDLMEYIYNTLYQYNIELGNFWMATNGTITSARFFNVLEDLYNYCNDRELNGLRVSIDNYHNQYEQKTEKFEEFIEYRMSEKVYLEKQGAPNDSQNLIGEGRAAENYYTTRTVKHGVDLLEDNRLEGTIYVNAKGYIISTCDISYDTEDEPDSEFVIGHVNDNWQEIFNRFFEKHPDLVCK